MLFRSRCDIYLGLLGYVYGSVDSEGISPTEREYDYASQHHKTRLVYVWGSDESRRDQAMKKLIHKASNELIRRRIEDFSALTSEVHASLADHLKRSGALLIPPFDDSVCDGATLHDIDNEQVTTFVETAVSKGRLALKGFRAPKAVLQNFNLLREGKPTNAAILLFGKNPRRFFNNAQVHCFHFLGTEKRKPIASHQAYDGRLFEVIDQSVEFVLGKLDRRVGTRSKSTQAPVEFEIPRTVITEAIVNAVAHRNYNNNGFVQVMVFADRVEVWNPGELPHGLTPELLRQPHGPIPFNPLIAEPLFRVEYVEKAGTGTTDMIAECRNACLPEPDFRQCGPHFITTLWRDWLTATVMTELELNDRQTLAIEYLKQHENITSADYQHIAECSPRTATRDLNGLVRIGVIGLKGHGRGAQYQLRKKRANNAPNAPAEDQ